MKAASGSLDFNLRWFLWPSNRSVLGLLVTCLTLSLLCVGCGTKVVPQIEVRVMDTRGHAFYDGYLYVDLYYGEDKSTAEGVDGWYTGPRGNTLRIPGTDVPVAIPGTDVVIPLPRDAPTPAGGDTVRFPTESGASLPGPGVYWVRVMTCAFHEEKATARVKCNPNKRTPLQAAADAGYEEGAIGGDNLLEPGAPYTISSVTAYFREMPSEAYKQDERDVIVDFKKHYCYQRTTWVRTQLGEDEQTDHVLVAVDTSRDSIAKIHDSVMALAKISRPVIGGILDAKFALTRLRDKVGRGIALTVLVRSVIDPESLFSTDTVIDVATGAVVTIAFASTADATFAGLALAIVPKLVVAAAENAQFQEHSRSDDFVVFASGALHTDGSIKGSGKVRIKNYGDTLYNVRVTAASGSGLSLFSDALSETIGELPPGKERELEWEIDWPDMGAFTELRVSYSTRPLASLAGGEEPYYGPSYNYDLPFTVPEVARTSQGTLRIVDFSSGVETGPEGTTKVQNMIVRVENEGPNPVKLFMYADHTEYGEKLIERRRKDPDGFTGPYHLGLEVKYRGIGGWESAGGYRWSPVERRPEDELTNDPPRAQIQPGEVREFIEIIPPVDSTDRSYRAFLLDPACGRIDERVLTRGSSVQ